MNQQIIKQNNNQSNNHKINHQNNNMLKTKLKINIMIILIIIKLNMIQMYPGVIGQKNIINEFNYNSKTISTDWSS